MHAPGSSKPTDRNKLSGRPVRASSVSQLSRKTSRRLVSIINPSGRTSHGKSARPGGRGGGRVQCMAEGAGFEPTEGSGPLTAIKAAAFVHSATPPSSCGAYHIVLRIEQTGP